VKHLGVCLLLLLIAPVQAEDGLGRLFFTPAERARLDALRAGTADDALPAPVPDIALPLPPLTLDPPPPAPPLAVNGLVVRERGPATAWINGAAGTRQDLDLGTGQDVRIGRRTVDVMARQDMRARVRPGQVFEPAQGRVVEAFEQQAPAPTEPPPAP
jgi:hypothetical protein